jgi:hypothetical protein
MNKQDIKIKYIIGSFREEPNYPTTEDFEYLILNWYFHENGKHFVHNYRTVEETGNPYFPANILIEKLNGNEESSKRLLDSLLSEGRIQVVKETRFTTYYEILKTGL